ncbi:MAG TPA: pantoate--beta-alanine ligase [Chitinophagaceae bacterium]|nr:pantoate--beta-alanine ligase [Chitinophagaceae bacterium]
MILFKQAEALKKHLLKAGQNAQTIGFVPTMGALHKGHLALIEQCRRQCDITVCSIFVNPVQFNDPKDYEKYPVTIENDILLLERQGTDILFAPPVAEMYPEGLADGIHYNIGYLENILEGYYRPGHFQGVCRVLHKFLNIVQPNIMFMGRKDYQQCMVVKRLLEEYNLDCCLEIVETLRETDGLAMSSRNLRLDAAARQKALAIYKALSYIKENISVKPIPVLKQQAAQIITEAGFEKIDYVEICDTETLKPAEKKEVSQSLVALVAAFINGIRLIDNMIVN